MKFKIGDTPESVVFLHKETRIPTFGAAYAEDTKWWYLSFTKILKEDYYVLNLNKWMQGIRDIPQEVQ